MDQDHEDISDMFWSWSETIKLEIIAEYSSTVSVVVVIGCFVSMAIFIIRLNINGKVDVNPGLAIPGQAMRGVYNPYSIQMYSEATSNFKDGVTLKVKCHNACILHALWGVSIVELYPQIYLPWEIFQHQIKSDTWLEGNVLYRHRKIELNISDEEIVKIKLPEGTDLQLGELPRDKYPLVVVCIQNDDDCQEQNTCVVSHISVFHLQDEQCSGKSHIIHQYIRTPIGQPYQLQPLYITTGGEETLTQPSLQREDCNSSATSSQCVVCQVETVNRALLPCRHACVCDKCFIHLVKCPMCRSPIMSYFQLKPTEGDNCRYDSHNEQLPQPWWERWNDRINHFFGFT